MEFEIIKNVVVKKEATLVYRATYKIEKKIGLPVLTKFQV